MSILASLLPKSFLTWVETESRTRIEKILGLADRQFDLAERELDARHKFVGLKQTKVKVIETDAE